MSEHSNKETPGNPPGTSPDRIHEEVKKKDIYPGEAVYLPKKPQYLVFKIKPAPENPKSHKFYMETRFMDDMEGAKIGLPQQQDIKTTVSPDTPYTVSTDFVVEEISEQSAVIRIQNFDK